MEIKIAGVVILYNPDEKVVENIKSYVDKFDRLYLVDNSEEDNSKQYEALGDVVEYIALFRNSGIAYAMNLAIDKAKERGFKYIITLDQDSSFATDVVKIYKEYINNHNIEKVAVLSPQYKTDRNELKELTGEQDVFITMQSGSLFVLDNHNKIGKFNELLFLDVVDWEYFLRVHKHKYLIIQCNAAILNHEPAITKVIKLGKREMKYGIAAPIRYYYQVRNLYWTAIKYKNLYMFFVMIIKFLKVILLFDNKKEYLTMCIQGIKDVHRNKMGNYSKN